MYLNAYLYIHICVYMCVCIYISQDVVLEPYSQGSRAWGQCRCDAARALYQLEPASQRVASSSSKLSIMCRIYFSA